MKETARQQRHLPRLARVTHPSLINQEVETAYDLLHRRSNVVSVSEDDVDVIHLQAGKGRLHALREMLARQTVLVPVLSSSSEEELCEWCGSARGQRGHWSTTSVANLGDDDELVAVVAELLDSPSKFQLGFSVCIADFQDGRGVSFAAPSSSQGLTFPPCQTEFRIHSASARLVCSVHL